MPLRHQRVIRYAALLSRHLTRSVTFADPSVFLRSLHELSPGCIVLDIRMPVISGLKLQERLTERQINWPVVIMSGHGDIEVCRRAFKHGAVDYLSKPVDEQDLIDAVQKGFERLEESQVALAEREELHKLVDQLTKREREVLDLVARGFSSKECADALSLSPRTIETHRSNIAAKMGTHSVAELTIIARETDKSR